MNVSIILHQDRARTKNSNRWLNLATTLLVGGLVLGATACKTTRAVSSNHIETSGFLNDYSQMHQGTNGQAALIYMDPAANWKKYNKIKIDPVQLWMSDDPDSALGKLSPEDQQMLVDTLYNSLRQHLGQDYQIVEHTGPDVLVVRVAITDAKKSKPVSNLISSVYLPLKVVSLGKRLATGTDIAVGSVTIEAELLDGQTNQRLTAVVDRRAGSKAIRTKFQGTWGDVKLAFDYWSQRLQTRLAEEKTDTMEKTEIGS